MHAIVLLCTVCTEVASFSGRGSFQRSILEETTPRSGVCDNIGSGLQGRQIIPSHLELTHLYCPAVSAACVATLRDGSRRFVGRNNYQKQNQELPRKHDHNYGKTLSENLVVKT